MLSHALSHMRLTSNKCTEFNYPVLFSPTRLHSQAVSILSKKLKMEQMAGGTHEAGAMLSTTPAIKFHALIRPSTVGTYFDATSLHVDQGYGTLGGRGRRILCERACVCLVMMIGSERERGKKGGQNKYWLSYVKQEEKQRTTHECESSL